MSELSESRRKWLILVIGVCLATMVGIYGYLFSLEHWGDFGQLLNFIGMIAFFGALFTIVLLILDIIRGRRRG